MEKLRAKVDYNKPNAVMFAICFILFSLIAMNTVEYLLVFGFQLNIRTIIAILMGTKLRGIFLCTDFLFTFYAYNIYVRYNLLNNHLR